MIIILFKRLFNYIFKLRFGYFEKIMEIILGLNFFTKGMFFRINIPFIVSTFLFSNLIFLLIFSIKFQQVEIIQVFFIRDIGFLRSTWKNVLISIGVRFLLGLIQNILTLTIRTFIVDIITKILILWIGFINGTWFSVLPELFYFFRSFLIRTSKKILSEVLLSIFVSFSYGAKFIYIWLTHYN